ncbi:MAG: membrane dipeptidase [Ignavibacteriaceae bacterium]|nr:membrane dipeptidase [Ignavibacteriaceae bacterium]
MKKILLTLLLAVSTPNFSQSISGTVTDSITQSAISNVKVIIKNLNTGSIDSTFSNSSGNWNYTFLTDISDNENVPINFLIAQNYPNPFNPSTTIEFIIPKSDNIQIFVHDVLGQLVDSRSQFLHAGNYSVKWNASGSAGVYFYTIKSSQESITKKMILLDGGVGSGLSEITQGNKLQNAVFNKSASVQASITISKLGYISKTINSEIFGGEQFNNSLITVHHNAVLIDLHNDVLEVIAGEPNYHLAASHSSHHTDIPRLQKGGVDIQFFADWIDYRQFHDTMYYDATEALIDIFNNEIALNPNTIGQARNLDEALLLNQQGKIAAVLAVEGGHAIENSLDNLVNLYNAGMRYMTITWNNSTSWATSAADPLSVTKGLSDFGKSVIRLMDSLGIIIDVSHTGIKTIQDILQVTTNPIIATHSGVRTIKNHYRNLYDSQIIDIAKSGGVIVVVFYPPFLTNGTAYIDNVIQHIDYIKNLVGIDYVAIGSDFDGIETTPVGLEDVSKFPVLTLKLLEKGYTQQEVEKILGGNFMRVFEKVCGSTKKLAAK